MHRTMACGLVVVALLAVHERADAATRTVLGWRLLVRDPRPAGHPSGADPLKRQIVIQAREPASPDIVVGDPILGGTTIELIANGASPSEQTFVIPGGPKGSGSSPGWTPITGGFRYRDRLGANGPVQEIVIQKTTEGTFAVRAIISAVHGAVDVAPPAPGTDGGIRLTVSGGDSYCVRFGGPALGKRINLPGPSSTTPFARTFKVLSGTNPLRESGGCASVQPCSFLATFGSFALGPPEDGTFRSPGRVATDGAGNVYVTDSTPRVQKFDASGTFLGKFGSAGTGNGQFDPLEGAAGIAVDGAGDIYVVDDGNVRVQKFDSTGGFLLAWGGPGSGDGEFDSPAPIAVDGGGNVYVGDAGNDRIQKFDSTGTFVSKWGTAGSGAGQFDGPTGIAVDGSGNVYVVDRLNERIQKFDAAGTFLTAWGSGCDLDTGAGCLDPDGAGPLEIGDGQFDLPFDAAVDGAGNVYVSDLFNDRIQQFDGSGTSLGKWGARGEARAEFHGPAGLATSASGAVYVADTGNARIQKFGCP